MNKKIIAIAIAAAMTAPVAMADITLSGKAQIAVFSNDAGTGTSDNGSKLVMKADSGPVSLFVDYKLGLSDTSPQTLHGVRNSFMNVKTQAGTFTLGNFPTATKAAATSIDMFADSAGDINNYGFDNTQIKGNGIGYSNKMGPVSIKLTSDLDSGSEQTTASVGVKVGPATITVASNTGDATNESTVLAVKANVGIVGLHAGYQTSDKSGTETTAMTVAAAAKLGMGSLAVQYITNEDASTTNIGYGIGLAKGASVSVFNIATDDGAGTTDNYTGVKVALSF